MAVTPHVRLPVRWQTDLRLLFVFSRIAFFLPIHLVRAAPHAHTACFRSQRELGEPLVACAVFVNVFRRVPYHFVPSASAARSPVCRRTVCRPCSSTCAASAASRSRCVRSASAFRCRCAATAVLLSLSYSLFVVEVALVVAFLALLGAFARRHAAAPRSCLAAA